MIRMGIAGLACAALVYASCAAGGRSAVRGGAAGRPKIASLRFFYWDDPQGFPSSEYGKGIHSELTQWDVGGGPAPGKFEIVVTVVNEDASRAATAVVTVERRYKVGPFVEDRQYGVTDFDRGYREARWTRYARIMAQKVALRPGERKSVIVPIDFEKIYGKYWARNRWPWFLQVRARIDRGKPVVRKLETVAGD